VKFLMNIKGLDEVNRRRRHFKLGLFKQVDGVTMDAN
jgi:hypothetical protein